MLRAINCGPIRQVTLARTFFGRSFYSVAAYLVDGLLVDSGPPHTARQLVRWCQGQNVRLVVNTHHHEDHSGGNAELQRVLNLPILAAPLTVALLADLPRIERYRRIVWGQPPNTKAQPLVGKLELDHYCFQVIPTPGHSADHVCLYEPEQRWLFSGDLFIHQRARYLRADEDLPALIQSVQKVMALRPHLMICCHAGFVDDPCGALEGKLGFWKEILGSAQALSRQGLSPREISRQVLGPEGMMTRISGGHISQTNLIRELLNLPADLAW